MLKACTEQDYKKYRDFVHELALDQSKSGYPTYSDGIKTKEMFFERAEKAFSRETEQILLFEYHGIVEGWIHYYWIPEDNYLSTVSFNINSATEEALREFLSFAEENFKGYNLFLGYSKSNKKAVEFLSTHGFECIEEDYNNTAFLEKYESAPENGGMVSVTKENYELFRKLHTQAEGDMYWKSDRIYADIENWVIFVKVKNNEPIGCVYYMDADDGWFEIFGIDLKDGIFNPALFRELVVKALNEAKMRGGKYMTFFCDEEGQEIASKIGFECVGEYVCFRKSLLNNSLI